MSTDPDALRDGPDPSVDGARPADDRTIDGRRVIDALPRAVVVSDTDGRILLWSAGARELYGWTEDEVLGRSVLDDLPAARRGRREPVRCWPARRPATSGTAIGSSFVATVSRSGSWPPASRCSTSRERSIAIVGTSEDVTELRLAEQIARDVSEHLRLALEAGGLGTWRWDIATGETIWDDRLRELFGVAETGFAGTFEAYAALLHPG